jgi:hypothetical protein
VQSEADLQVERPSTKNNPGLRARENKLGGGTLKIRSIRQFTLTMLNILSHMYHIGSRGIYVTTVAIYIFILIRSIETLKQM